MCKVLVPTFPPKLVSSSRRSFMILCFLHQWAFFFEIYAGTTPFFLRVRPLTKTTLLCHFFFIFLSPPFSQFFSSVQALVRKSSSPPFGQFLAAAQSSFPSLLWSPSLPSGSFSPFPRISQSDSFSEFSLLDFYAAAKVSPWTLSFVPFFPTPFPPLLFFPFELSYAPVWKRMTFLLTPFLWLVNLRLFRFLLVAIPSL